MSELVSAAGGKQDPDGWHVAGEGQSMTVYVASGGASLTVSKITAVKHSGGLLLARTQRDEEYVLQIKDVFAGAADRANVKRRAAGFV